jgi:phosphoribosylglycinamide formyltransferase 1
MTKTETHLAILASGSGTNAENIIRYFQNHPSIRVSVVISNKADAKVHERAASLGVPSEHIPSAQWNDQEYITVLLEKYNINFLVLAGYLLLLPSWLVKKFPQRIVNIHPALLPSYGGKGMFGAHVHTAVIAAREKKSGITIHFVNEHYDKGDIIFQAQCPVLPFDTADTLAQRIHTLEYEHYPRLIEQIIKTEDGRQKKI